jgi:hypothetical protein
LLVSLGLSGSCSSLHVYPWVRRPCVSRPRPIAYGPVHLHKVMSCAAAVHRAGVYGVRPGAAG